MLDVEVTRDDGKVDFEVTYAEGRTATAKMHWPPKTSDFSPKNVTIVAVASLVFACAIYIIACAGALMLPVLEVLIYWLPVVIAVGLMMSGVWYGWLKVRTFCTRGAS